MQSKRSHEALARTIRAYLDARMDRRVTLRELTEEFHASGTLIKASYRALYGESLYADTKARKMHSAARMLRETDLSILEIAGMYSYDNASKFAAAFRSVTGVTPREYRKESRLPAKHVQTEQTRE